MATVLGMVGFILGMLAIWLAAEALRRVHDKNDKITQPKMRGFKAQSARMSAMIDVLETRLSKLERRVHFIEKTDILKSNANLANPVGPYNPKLNAPFTPSYSHNA